MQNKEEINFEKQSSIKLKKNIKELYPNISEEILDKVDEQIELQKNSPKMSPSILSNELMSVYPEAKKTMNFAVILACVGEVFSFASYLFGAYAASWIISYTNGKNLSYDELIFYATLGFFSLILSLTLTGISTTLSHRTAFSILSKLRISLFDKLQRIELGYMVENQIGKIKVIIQERTGELEDWVAHMMPEVPSRLLHPILCVIILFIIDWRIGLSILAPLPFIILGMSAMMYKYKTRIMIWHTSYSNVADKSSEYVRGIPVIKAFLQDEKSYGHFSDAVKFYHSSTMDWWKQSWFGMALSGAAGMSPLLVTLPLAFHLYSMGEITISTLVLSIVLPLSILPQAILLMSGFELFTVAGNTWLSIRELLFMEEQKRPSSDEKKELDKDKAIEFKNVSFSYKSGIQVLSDISFESKLNEMTAIVGPSGSGKTTIARLIAGYWDVDSGEIYVGGINTKKLSFEQLNEEISYVSQDNYLFDTSIKENIKLGKPEASDEEVIQAAKAANCHDFIMNLPKGYETSAGDAGSSLSGGEKQRITLARAFIKPSNILVLDEATAYADPENEFLIQDAISKLIKGKSLIVIAHRLHTIRNAQNIIVMDNGKIIAQGKHEELLNTCELYRNLNNQYNKEI